MTEFAASVSRRFRVGMASVPVAGVLMLVGAAVSAQVQAYGWVAFQNHCLAPYEDRFAPDVIGLTPVASDDELTRFELPGGINLTLEHEPVDGLSACRIETAAPQDSTGFESWAAEAADTGRYIPDPETEGGWLSHGWAEPVLSAQKYMQDGVIILRMLETDREA